MKRLTAIVPTVVLTAGLLAACGTDTTDRAEGGAAVGAASGAAIGAVFGGVGAIPGALIGAAVGGGTGAATDKSQIDLGEPVWEDKSPHMAQAPSAGPAPAVAAAPAPAMQPMSAQTALAGDDVRHAQIALKHEGFYRGHIDGIAGPQTRAAVAAYQRKNGLQQTNMLDGQTLASLENDRASNYGSSGLNRAPAGGAR